MKEELIQIRVSEQLKKDLLDYCQSNGISMSEAIRYFIRTGVNSSEAKPFESIMTDENVKKLESLSSRNKKDLVRAVAKALREMETA